MNTAPLFLLLFWAAGARAVCPEQRLLPNPEDPGAWGPHPVGTRVLEGGLGGARNLTAQIWFPAAVGSEGQPYWCDLRTACAGRRHD